MKICPVCNKKCTGISGVWFSYDCRYCEFEYFGSSGITFNLAVKLYKKKKKRKKEKKKKRKKEKKKKRKKEKKKTSKIEDILFKVEDILFKVDDYSL